MRPLLGRTLILVAHPDDEAVGCGGLLQRMQDPIVVFATDGAPRSDFFWGDYGSRDAYARVRRQEAETALKTIDLKHLHFLCEDDPVVDQELYMHLERAYGRLIELLETEMPDAILTMAYEGGHPDHDACCFLATTAANEFELPVWEMPLYHRAATYFQPQQFLDGDSRCEIALTREEVSRKRRMWRAYRSQRKVLREFVPDAERFRPLVNYDFACPPHAGKLNYEAWHWPMNGSDLCAAFAVFRQKSPLKKREWGTVA